jgi:hypothetical protein
MIRLMESNYKAHIEVDAFFSPCLCRTELEIKY